MTRAQLSEAEDFALRSLAKHEGEWGWYQLDRTLSMNGFLGSNALNILSELTSRNLIEPDGDPQQASTHYRLTAFGRQFCAQSDSGSQS